MKKAILTLAAIASVAAANAQHMGEVFVYGGVGFNYNKPSNSTTIGGVTTTDETKYQSGFLTPGIGYQLDHHWGVGVQLNATLDKTDVTGGDKSKTTTFLVGPFVRYTQHLGEHFFVYGQFTASYVHGKQKDEPAAGGSDEETYNGFDFTVMPGIGINLSHCWSVTGAFGSLGYQHYKYTDPDGLPAGVSVDRKNDAFGVSFGQQFTLGVQWQFGGHMHKGHHEMMDDTRRMDTSDDSSDMDHGKKKKKDRKNDDE